MPATDASEREATAVADRVAGRHQPLVEPAGSPSPAVPDRGLGRGRPLDHASRTRFEATLGVDLGAVRVHDDASAGDAAGRARAAAYTLGNHIVFGRDRFAPTTARGSWLLAHEFAHVRQHADGGSPAVVHRAPEDVPALDQKLYEGVKAGGSEGYKRAAEALNAFADFDIKLRISGNPGGGRPKLSRGQIAGIHAAALDHPSLGPGSNVATYSRPAYLDMNFENEVRNRNWQRAARFMNAFSDPDMETRLSRLPMETLRALQLGALQDPQVGGGSALARNVEKAIKTATTASINLAVAEGQRTGDLTPATTTAGTGPPGSLVSLTVGGSPGNPNVGVPEVEREPLAAEKDWSTDGAYIDRNVAHASYDLLTGLFQIQYANGGFLNLQLDEVTAGAGAGRPALVTNEPVYFRSKTNGRIYPTRFSKATIPVITACAVEILRLEPEARGRLLGALIDVAVAAHGVGRATISANQAAAGTTAAGKPAKKTTTEGTEGGGGSSSKATGGKPVGKTDTGQASGGGTPGGGATAADKPGLSASGTGKASGSSKGPPSGTTKGGQGELQQAGSGGSKGSLPPPEAVSPEALKGLKWPGGNFGKDFKYVLEYGAVTAARKELGQGALVAAKAGTSVAGSTATVAEGSLVVGGTALSKATVVSGGKIVPSAPGVGRPVAYALVLVDAVYWILSSAPGTDTPAQAPGKDTGSAVVPGKDSSAVTTPGADKAPPAVKDPTQHVAVEEPGPLVDVVAECKKLIGSKVTHDHHVFPQKFRQRFAELQIEIDEWTITMRWDEHVGKNGVHAAMGWNDYWDDFFFDMPEVSKMTAEQARGWQLRAKNFGFRLMVEAGIDRRKLHPWGK